VRLVVYSSPDEIGSQWRVICSLPFATVIRVRIAPHPRQVAIRALALVAVATSLTSGRAAAQQSGSLQAVTDQITYNTGEVARLRLISPGEPGSPGMESHAAVRLAASIRYEAATDAAPPKPVWHGALFTGPKLPAGYLTLWRIPPDAATGRYEVEVQLMDAASDRVLAQQPRATSFTVHHKLVRIDHIEMNKEIYTSGDAVNVSVTLRNLSAHPLKGLRVEFSDRYWPWIAGPTEQAKASIVVMNPAVDLTANETSALHKDGVALAPDVKQSATHQYGVVVWDHDRKQALDIAFSRLVFVDPPGFSGPRPYPGQYVYPDLTSVNVKSYRHFYPAGMDSAAISFDHDHTMFAPAATAVVNYRVSDPGPDPWRAVRIEERLLRGGQGDQVSGQEGPGPAVHVAQENVNLEPAAGGTVQPLAIHSELKLPSDQGLYRLDVRVVDQSGEVLARNDLELAVNPMPKSLLFFCAHEDDEGGWYGMIRAAVENQIPIHFVYFTGGDAGACDRYYEHSCGPEEALNYGYIRMQETRAVLGHLGVPADDILFIGLPDGGSGEIWYHHPGVSAPYLAPLLATDHVPYEGMAFPNLPYARDAVVDAAAKLIDRFKPAVIVTPHPPQEGHIDHIVDNYFVVKALHELSLRGGAPAGVKVLVDRIYLPKEHPATPYRYSDQSFAISGEAAALAQEAGWYYQSQGGNHSEGNFIDFGELRREQRYREVVDWSEFEGWNEKEPVPATQPQGPAAPRAND
jgi:LmbE family N-acetylglucosaminyl deacetylase